MPYCAHRLNVSASSEAMSRAAREGREEGLEEGRRAEAGLVSRLLRRRFGAVPEEITERIAALPKDRIEALGDALLDFASLTDLDAWLQRH